jgi:hypothetical protein
MQCANEGLTSNRRGYTGRLMQARESDRAAGVSRVNSSFFPLSLRANG